MLVKDLSVKFQIDNTHLIHPAYGHKRLALALGYSHNKILRIMHKFGIKPPRRKIKRKWVKSNLNSHHYTNLIRKITPIKPSQIFVTDLTYLKYQSKQFYLATVEDIFTREIVSFNLSDRHDSVLALSAIQRAVNITKPTYFHSDQGSEFMAQTVTQYLEQQDVKVSVSDKGSPWQNGYKESFYGRFKDEFGDLNRFNTLGELVEEIYGYIHYYNNQRIHTSLKMTPIQYKEKYINNLNQPSD